jgi:hypothetical protein
MQAEEGDAVRDGSEAALPPPQETLIVALPLTAASRCWRQTARFRQIRWRCIALAPSEPNENVHGTTPIVTTRRSVFATDCIIHCWSANKT